MESYLGQANPGVFTPYTANSTAQSFSLPFFYGLNPPAFVQGQMMAMPIYLPINSNMFSYWFILHYSPYPFTHPPFLQPFNLIKLIFPVDNVIILFPPANTQ